MVVIMTLALLIGIAMLITGAMLLGAPESLYHVNQYVIKLIFNINEYLNKLLLKFNSYLNNLILKQEGGLAYRLVIAFFYIIIGISLIYSYYYYSQHGDLPPVINAFFTGVASHFR